MTLLCLSLPRFDTTYFGINKTKALISKYLHIYCWTSIVSHDFFIYFYTIHCAMIPHWFTSLFVCCTNVVQSDNYLKALYLTCFWCLCCASVFVCLQIHAGFVIDPPLLSPRIFFLLALQPPLGVVFYSPLVGFSLLAYEVSWSHTTTRHSR